MRRLGGAALLMGLVATACTSTPPTTTTTTSTTTTTTTTTTIPTTTTTTIPIDLVPEGGSIVIGMAIADEPVTLNPLAKQGDSVGVAIMSPLYSVGAFNVSADTLELIPEVLEQFPTVSNGGVEVNEDGTMSVTYEILREAVWSDGTPISGEDFLFTLDTILDPETGAETLIYEDIVETAVESKSFTFTLALPTLRYELLFPTLLPKHAVEGSNFLEDWNDELWPVGGPYELAEWTPGEEIRFTRNASYWKTNEETRQQLPYLEEVIFRFYDDEDEVVDAYVSREVDVIAPAWSKEAVHVLERAQADVTVVNGRVWEHLAFQYGPGRLARNELSQNQFETFRKAIMYAIDRDAIVTELFGDSGAVQLTSYVDRYIPAISGHAWDQYPYDPPKAAGLIVKLKTANELETLQVVFTTSDNSPERVAVVDLIAPMLADVGIEFIPELEDSLLFFGATLSEGDFDMGFWAWRAQPGFSGLVRIHDVFDPEGAIPQGANYYRWGTEDSSVKDESTLRFAELRDAMRTTVDDEELVPLIAEAEAILADTAVILPIYSLPVMTASRPRAVIGPAPNGSTAEFTWNVETWHMPEQG